MIRHRQGATAHSRLRVGLGAAVVLLLVGLAVAILLSAFSSADATRTVPAGPLQSGPPQSAPRGSRGASPGGAPIFVHILGAVASPGLYELHDGDRAVDAIAAAGGFTEAADRQHLNLARFVSDGEQILVPAVGEATTAPEAAAARGGKVNLNTADATALESLPRVGPAMAKRIIAWRDEHGRFASVDDLLSVSGIGDKTFAELKDLVTV
jgi:competence protein ComEA